MAQTPSQVAQGPMPAWPKDALRIAFGLIWAIDAALKWLPGFRAGYMSLLMAEAQGQPSWLRPWFDFWINLQHPRVDLFVYLSATIESLIAAALILGFARKLTYISATAFSLIIWSTAAGSGDRTRRVPRTSAPASSTRWCSWACWLYVHMPARRATASTTGWSSASHGGGGWPRCAGPARPCPRPRVMSPPSPRPV